MYQKILYEHIDNNNTPPEIFDFVGHYAFRRFLDRLIFYKTAGAESPQPAEFLPLLVFAVNPGCGFSEALELYAETLEKFSAEGDPDVVELIMTEPDEYTNIPGTARDIADIITQKNHCLIGIDISDYTGTKLREKLMSDVIDTIRRYRKDGNYFVLRVGRDERDSFESVLNYLSEFIDVRGIDFPQLSAEEYADAADIMLRRIGLEMNEDCRLLFIDEIEAERKKSSFYGFKTAMKIVDRLRFAFKQNEEEYIASEPRNAAVSRVEVRQPALDEFEGLIGLSDIKNQIIEIAKGVKYRKDMAIDRPNASMHMIFTGPPGTGKTTVARLIGRIFKENGILPVGNLVEVTRKDLVGEFIGQTALKTVDVCRMAMGSVLFIDEAYELAQDTQNRRDFGPEAISTLITEMENKRDKFVVIMAGYEKDMERLFTINAGLRDRFAYRIEFPNFTRDQLADIFMYIAGEKQHIVGAEMEAVLRDYFSRLDLDLIESRSFANARFVRNLVERTVSKAAIRFVKQRNYEQMDVLLPEDFTAAINDADFIKQIEKHSKNRIGFKL